MFCQWIEYFQVPNMTFYTMGGIKAWDIQSVVIQAVHHCFNSSPPFKVINQKLWKLRNPGPWLCLPLCRRGPNKVVFPVFPLMEKLMTHFLTYRRVPSNQLFYQTNISWTVVNEKIIFSKYQLDGTLLFSDNLDDWPRQENGSMFWIIIIIIILPTIMEM